MNTRKEIVDRIFYILGEEQDSTVFDKDGEVLPKLENVIDSICRCKVTNLITQTDIKGGLLDFLFKEKSLKVPTSKKLMADIDEDSQEIAISDTIGLPYEGFIEINGNIINYNGCDEENGLLLNVEGINGPHDIHSNVNFVYILPTDLIKIGEVFSIKRNQPLNQIDFRESVHGTCYSIKPFHNKKAVIFYNVYEELRIRISRSQQLERMYEDDDVCGFPDDFGVKILPYLVAGELLIDTSEIDKGQKLLQIGYNALENMYSFYATPSKKHRRTIRVKPLPYNGW